jgi:hypothetical protein
VEIKDILFETAEPEKKIIEAEIHVTIDPLDTMTGIPPETIAPMTVHVLGTEIDPETETTPNPTTDPEVEVNLAIDIAQIIDPLTTIEGIDPVVDPLHHTLETYILQIQPMTTTMNNLKPF